ncbi:MAG: dehydrogenase [Candidatus Omnitrophica bacterium]|nr:dehydrogenase [Candidatus Omnitrophota bacterium]
MYIRSRSPLRIGLAGGGTDVSPYSDVFGGAVLNATISMYAYATIVTTAARAGNCREGVHFRFVAVDKGGEHSFVTDGKTAQVSDSDTFRLHCGVFNRIVHDYGDRLTAALQGVAAVELTTYVDAPAGSGLGTSSTLTATIIGAFGDWLKLPLGEYDTARLAYDIERVDLAMAGGKQDQYAATFGGFNFMEFYADNRVIVNPLRVKQEFLNELEFNLILYYTGTSRLSADIIAAQMNNVTQKNEKSLEAMHQVKEHSFRMKEAILKGKLCEIGAILDEAWQAKKMTAAGVSNPMIDEIYDAAKHAGALGGKVSGAGGGGFMFFYCPQNTRYKVIETLQKFGGEFRRYHFTESGLTTWRTDSQESCLKAALW